MYTSYIPFNADVYEGIERSEFYRRLNEELLKYLHSVVVSTEPLPGMIVNLCDFFDPLLSYRKTTKLGSLPLFSI